MSQTIHTKTQAVMSARVFRRNKKPSFISQRLWNRFPKISLFGRWEELGNIASTDQGNLKVTQQ